MGIRDITFILVLIFSGCLNVYLSKKDGGLKSLNDYMTCFLFGAVQFPFVIGIIVMYSYLKMDNLFHKQIKNT